MASHYTLRCINICNDARWWSGIWIIFAIWYTHKWCVVTSYRYFTTIMWLWLLFIVKLYKEMIQIRYIHSDHWHCIDIRFLYWWWLCTNELEHFLMMIKLNKTFLMSPEWIGCFLADVELLFFLLVPMTICE